MKLEDFRYFVSGAGPNGPAGDRFGSAGSRISGAAEGKPALETASEATSSPSSENQKPWLIFLHGLLGSAANWRRITPAFEADFRVLTFDQRGHGRSFKPRTGYDPADFAADLKFLTDTLKIETFNLVGHSMGGRNAFSFAALYPERVKKLVIEDIGPMASDDARIDSKLGLGGGVADSAPAAGLSSKRRTGGHSNKTGLGLVKLLRAVPVPFADKMKAKEYFLNDLGDPKFGGYLYTNIITLPDGRATWAFDMNTIVEIIEKGRGQNRWREIEALKCPTLLLRGERSHELPRGEFEEMLRRNPLIKGVEIADAGHWIHSDQPEKFVEVVKRYLLPFS